jgi:Polyketide cyclase / dehydrase and lipid transport
MAANDYVFCTRWRVEATPEEVFQIIEKIEEYPRWWGRVWLSVERIEEGDANAIGRRFKLFTQGWLPYRLRWESRTTEKIAPTRLALTATGDFVGSGVWTFAADGAFTDVTYDWRLRADKPLLRVLSFLLKPLFRWNHNWAMARGLEGLQAELQARRTTA